MIRAALVICYVSNDECAVPVYWTGRFWDEDCANAEVYWSLTSAKKALKALDPESPGNYTIDSNVHTSAERSEFSKLVP